MTCTQAAARRSCGSCFPLTIPGIFAAFLLTFVPAMGDYLNQQILGGTPNTMIGTIIQNDFLINQDYPAASALSAILLAFVLIGIFLVLPHPGREDDRGVHLAPSPPPRPPRTSPPSSRSAVRRSRRGGGARSCRRTRPW